MISKNITTRTTVFAPDGSNNNRNNNNGDLLWRGFGAERRSKMATGGEKWRGFVCERDTGTRMYRYSMPNPEKDVHRLRKMAAQMVR
jgi:hypothetical protein